MNRQRDCRGVDAQVGPSENAVLERALSLANEAMHTVALQVRRLGSREPEDHEFVMRWWADLQFLIVALRRLRRAVSIAGRVPRVTDEIHRALRAFDASVPSLLVMRNVGEHIDAYAVDDQKRHRREIDRRMIQAGSWDGRRYSWLADENDRTLTLDVVEAKTAAERLLEAARAASRNRA